MLHPEKGDVIKSYDCEPMTNPITGERGYALKKVDGHCVYLGENGCTIHDRAPVICREFDCRRYYKLIMEKTTKGDRRRMIRAGVISNETLHRAKQLIHQEEKKDG